LTVFEVEVHETSISGTPSTHCVDKLTTGLEGATQLTAVATCVFASATAVSPPGPNAVTKYVYSIPDPACPSCADRWLIQSEGIVNNQQRTLEVILGKYDITKAINTEGTVNIILSPNDITATTTTEYLNVFGGVSADYLNATSTTA